MKKILMMIVLLPLMALAEKEIVDGIEWNYSVKDGVAVVAEYKYGIGPAIPETTIGNIKIPSELGGLPVTSIGDGAFLNCLRLTSVTIPAGVTSIGSAAFSGCNRLMTVQIPDSVKSVGDNAFVQCGELTNVSFPAGVTNIGENAFQYCKKLTHVKIPSGVKAIKGGLFECCSGLESVEMPADVTSIGSEAFYGCKSLKSLKIPNSVTVIGNKAFAYCSGLASVIIPSGLRYKGTSLFAGCSGLISVDIPDDWEGIDQGMFAECSELTTINIPNSVLRIMPYAFSDCHKLESLVIPSGVASIEGFAFENCLSLREVMIPISVTNVAQRAFSGCESLREFMVEKGNRNYRDINGLLCSKDGDAVVCGVNGDVDIPTGVITVKEGAFDGLRGLETVTMPNTLGHIEASAFSGCRLLENVVIPDGVVDISEGAFAGCRSLMSIALPSGLTKIAKGTFSGCMSLLSIDIPDKVSCVEQSAFSSCSSLRSVELPSNLRSIDALAFDGCTALTELAIPEKVTDIGYYAFGHCKELRTVAISRSVVNINTDAFSGCCNLQQFKLDWYNPSYSSIDGMLCDKQGTKLILGVNGDVVIPQGIKSIGPMAFYGLNDLRSVQIASSVVSIGHGAFRSCSGLTSVVIYEGVRSIGEESFSGCVNLKTISIPSSVTSIGNGAFSNCSQLESVDIPDSVTYMGEGAFASCKRLVSVEIPSSMLSIPWGMFENCEELVSVKIPDSVRSIDTAAFYNCSSLVNAEIPSSVTTIGEAAFGRCSSLTSISIPISVEKVYPYAFSGCSGLNEFEVDSENVTYQSVNGCLCSQDGTMLVCGINGDVVLPDGVTDIGRGAFRGLEGLRSVRIPASVSRIADDAFRGCSGLMMIDVDKGNPAYSSRDGMLYSKDGLVLLQGCNGNVAIPNGVIGIQDGAFAELEGLVSVRIPSSVMYIGNDAFLNCRSLRYIYKPWAEPEISKGLPSEVVIVRPVSVAIVGCDNQYVYDGRSRRQEVTLKSDIAEYNVSNVISSLGTGVLNVGTTLTQLTTEMFWNTNEEYEVTFTLDSEESICRTVVLPRKVNITTASAEKVFDGEPLVQGRFSILGDGFVAGECAARAVGAQTCVGTSRNSVVLEWAAGASESNYSIVTNEGTLTVLPARVTKNGDEPGNGTISAGGFSKFDGEPVKYDGKGHSINVTSLESVTLVADTPSFSYSLTSNGVYRTEPYCFTNACVTSVWYKISAPNYEDYVHEARVTILPREVTLMSGSATKNFDGTALTCERVEVAGDGFVEGEGLDVTYTGSQIWPGASENAFVYSFKGGTRSSNYKITARTGNLSVTAAGRVVFDTSVTSVPSAAFVNCSELTEVVMRENVTEIGEGAFAGCPNLTKVWFSAGLNVTRESLANWGLSEVVLDDYIAGDYIIVNTSLLGYVGTRDVAELVVPDGVKVIDECVLAELYDLKRVEFSDTVTSIGKGAFANDTYLDGVVLPDSVEVIGAGAFENCSWMQTMTMGAGVKVVGERAFAGCTKMATVSFAEGLDEIGDAAFSNCWRMLSLALPLSITNVAATAFADCSSLKGVTVPTAVAPLSTWFAPVYRQIEDVTVPDGTTEVCAEMFAGCSALKSVSLPEGVTNIACGAFRDCSELETILLPESLTSIGDEAFAGCAALKAIVLPEHVATIGKRAFSGCSSLADVTLSRALTAIPDGTFAGCAALDSFVVPASVTQLGSQIVPSATTAIYYLGNAPTFAADVYAQANAALVSYVVNGTKGWDGRPTSRDIPQSWPVDNARAIQFWSPVREVKVRFNATGGTVEPDERSYVSEAAFGELPVPTRTHYDFVGWFTEAIGGSQMTVASEVPLADRELFAHWTPKQYVIRFHANDGTGATVDQSFVYGATVGLRTNDFVRTGYAFAGWATRLDGEAVYADGRLLTNVSAVEDGVIHLYAVWTPHDYWVRFDSNDGTGAMEAIKFAYDEEGALSTNAFARTGYRFAGWAMDRAARPESAPYREGETVRNLTAEDGATVTLYAVWEAHAYRISYNANGGDGEMVDAPCTYDLDTTVAANAFTRLGYRFVGWSLDAAARPESAPYREGETVRNLTAEDGATVTLYAVWEADDDLWHDDGCFSGSAANVYDGCLLDQDESLIGLVQVKTAKQVVKGGDTNVTTTATVTDQTGKTWSYSKGTASVDGTVSGLVCTTKGCPVPKFDVVLGKNGLSGDWGGYEIVGARRVKPGDYAKNWTVSFANGDWLQLKVDAAGVAKVVGWAAGKAYSASTQLIVGDGFAYVPVLSGKNATLIRIENPASGGEHPVGVITSTSGEEARGGVTAKPQFDGWEESDNAMVGVAFRTVPRMDGLGWPMTFKASGLPSGCKINEKTGVISGIPTKAGTFVAKVTATSASNKKWTATCAVTNSIVALPEWAKGQFAGVADGADVTMTVGSTGKVSGKFKVGITNWTFAASSFTTNSVTRGVTNLICAATAQGTYSYKSGKTTKTAKVAEPLEFALFAQPDVSPLAAAGVGDFADATENVGLWRVAAVKLTADGAGGTVKTDKSYGQAAAGGKVKLTATLKKGWAFLGWYDLAGESDGPVSQATTYALVSDGVTDRFLEARFVKEAELSAADFELAWNAPTNVCCGVSYSAKPSVSGAAAVKIASVTGLPKGLAWASGKATGVPTSVQTNTVTVKFALVTNAKKTFAQKFRLAVNPLPDWAVQTLAGDLGTEESPVPVTVTIGSKGAVSGKYVLNGNEKWTFSAKALSSAEYDAITQEPLSFEAKVTASATIKNKKRTQNLLVTVLPEGVAVDER